MFINLGNKVIIRLLISIRFSSCTTNQQIIDSTHRDNIQLGLICLQHSMKTVFHELHKFVENTTLAVFISHP